MISAALVSAANPLTGCKCTTRSEEHTSELQSHVNLVCRLLLEKKNTRIVAVDLTESVDTLRGIVVRRSPEFLDRILFVQASIFALPFRPGSFDYVYSLGVLHHTGNTREAIRAAASLVADGGELNFWIYAAAMFFF